MHPFLYRYRFVSVWLLFALHLGFFWPGFITVDASNQYKQALAFQFSDAHPPLMACLWHYLNQVIPGTGGMYAIQIVLFYSGLHYLLKTCEMVFDFKKHPALLFFIFGAPFLPTIFFYSLTIAKDWHFTFVFFFISSFLSFYTLCKKKLSLLKTFFLLILLIYGMAVKYQAWYCGFFLILWMGYTLSRSRFMQAISALVCACFVYGTITCANNFLVPTAKKSHFWQFVKLYDLASLSVYTKQDLIPEFNKTKSYTFQRLLRDFHPKSVDPYIHTKDNIFKAAPAHQDTLLKTWRTNVFAHPIAYLWHRARLMGYALLSRICFRHVQDFLDTTLSKNTLLYKSVYCVASVLGFVFLSCFPMIVLLFFYLYLGIKALGKSKVAPLMLAFLSTALCLLLITFFMSMAGVPRYLYMVIVMVNGCHLFAYDCLQSIKTKKKFIADQHSC